VHLIRQQRRREGCERRNASGSRAAHAGCTYNRTDAEGSVGGRGRRQPTHEDEQKYEDERGERLTSESFVNVVVTTWNLGRNATNAAAASETSSRAVTILAAA
jgi:hypothetical protein